MIHLPILQSPRPHSWIKGLALRLYRAAVLIAIVCLIHRHHARLRIDGDAPIQLDEARAFFPSAADLKLDESDRMGLFVTNRDGQRLGYLLRTSPVTDKIVGYSGPTDTLIAMDPDMRVLGIRVRSSADTKQHVRDVKSDAYFMKTWTGKTWDQVAGMDPKSAHIEGVSGASLTSLCIANGIQQRFKHSTQAAAMQPALKFRAADIGLILMIAIAIIFSFTSLRSHTWCRRAFQLVLIGYVGFWNGQLLAQSLLGGWAANGAPWRIAPGLVLLAATSLIVPWGTRRALYCSQICPHGAAQELLGRLTRRRLRIPKNIEQGLRWLPGLLIAFVLVVVFYRLPIDLADIEPFDAYLIRAAGSATLLIAVIGLIAAIFVPMAYCKYGCPTGLLLSFVRSHARADTFGHRDLGAGLLLLFAIGLYFSYGAVHHWILR